MVLQSHSWEYIWGRLKTLIQKVTCPPTVHSSAVYNSQVREATKYPPTDGWVKKTRYTYAAEYYSVFKKKEIIHLQPHGWT